MVLRSSTREHWERYWTNLPELDDVYTNEGRVIEQLMRLDPSGKRVLEVGAGSARDSITLARAGATMVIVDYSGASLDVARRAAEDAGAPIALVRGDALALPFREGAFGIAFHQGLLEHFRDPMPLLAENRRVLAPGGHLLVDVPQAIHPYTVAKKGMILLGKWFAGWETQFTIGRLERLLESAGLSVVGAYGDWMVPGFFYRSLRYGLRRLGWVLPKYPRGIPPFAQMARFVREKLRGTRTAFYTYAMIGAVGQRPLED
jgi:SAM-dependent methyltransferase